MALDRLGNTITAGLIYVLAGTVRRITGDSILIGLHEDSDNAVRCDAADIVAIDDLGGGGGGGGDMMSDGSVPFTAPVDGVAGGGTDNLATNGYVDYAISVAQASIIATAYLAFQPLSALLTAVNGAGSAADRLCYYTGTNTAALATFTSAARSLVASTTVGLMLKVLGGGTSATGTGGVVLDTSPTLTTPNLGTPTALVLTSATGLPTAGLVNDAVTFAKMQNLATDTLIGRDTAGTGDPEAISVSGGLEFSGSAGIRRSALTGDVTATAGSNTTTIANDAVTYAKMQNVSATDKVLGRSTAGAGDPEEIACTATGRSLIAAATAEAVRQLLEVGNTEQQNVWMADFYMAVPTVNGWTSQASGTGANYGQHWSTMITTTEKGIGVIELKPGTTSTGWFGLFTGNDILIKGQAKFTFEIRIALSTLSGGGDTYRVHFGLGNNQFASTNPSGGHYAGFTYDPDVYGNDNWQALTSDGTATTTDSTVAATANVFQILKLELNEAGTACQFWVNGVSIGTHSTHLPTGRIGPFVKVVKTSGTNDRPVYIDWTRFVPTLSGAR